MAITREHVLQALSTVTVDASGTDLVASGRLSDVHIDDAGRVMFSIAVDPSEAQAMEQVRQTAATAVQGLPGVKGVFASLTADRPAGSAPQSSPAAAQRPRAAAQPKNQRIPGVKHVIAVASGKGGVGKSTTACNLALGLAALGLKVGVLDADIYGPSMPKLFGIHGKPKLLENRILEPMEAYGLKVMSIGFLVEEEAAMIWRGPMVMSAITQMLREVAWGDLDVLVVDMPPGTGDAQLTMAQATPLAGAVIVSTPQDLALIDARRGVSMFKRVEIPILGIVENMATFVCPHCGQSSHIFGHGGARSEAERLGVPFLGEVPLNMTIRELSDAGRPVVATDPKGPHATIYKDMAQRIWTTLSGGETARPAPRIVIE
ncbi:Mrp/NBP35 family ATP-binding protein [Microvirga guangxiensis]|uniref:Iron-sulfur cluster carrier protein n=1 Tax=Microvirga guangxiensis TaxID=549386 RepID=A0A1G5CJ20_9HYPH|nr:Mrp/NBP35 family ATP-binding protein [Microvirga guangxiensis]SCY02318.1 ATP-binding protein involved in chromosome partitioning [Microvirga guangxiensis]